MTDYPTTWPRCPSCGKPALDGHLTCGAAACNEGEARRLEERRWRLRTRLAQMVAEGPRLHDGSVPRGPLFDPGTATCAYPPPTDPERLRLIDAYTPEEEQVLRLAQRRSDRASATRHRRVFTFRTPLVLSVPTTNDADVTVPILLTAIAAEGVEEEADHDFALLALDVLVSPAGHRHQYATAVMVSVRHDNISSAQLSPLSLRLPQSLLDSVKEEP
jgi:hypothetical protein